MLYTTFMIYLDHAAATPEEAHETNQRFFSSLQAKDVAFAWAALFEPESIV